MPSVIQHRCRKMIRDNNKPNLGSYAYIYERNQDGIWRLLDGDKQLKVNCNFCEWCDRNLRYLEEYRPSNPSAPHRCVKMIEVEHRRNEEKANHPGDRLYVISWLPESGWTLFNKNEKTERTNLHECPFCRVGFPFLNQVFIE